MAQPLPRFNAFDALREVEQADGSPKKPDLATLETLADIPSPPPLLKSKILSFTDDDWDEIEERSAIIEYDGGMPRFEAETRAIMEQLAKREAGNGGGNH